MGKKRQHKDMADAYSEMSTWIARNKVQAMKAKKEGNDNWAAVFKALSLSDEICARRLLMYLRGKVQASEDYVAEQLGEKRATADEIFPEMLDRAKADSDASAIEHFDRTGRVAKNQAGLLSRAQKDGPRAERTYYICEVCGFVAVDKKPDECPVCHAIEEKISEVTL